MAQSDSTTLAAQVASLIDRTQLERDAVRVGWIQRLRKLNPWAFVWTLILGFGSGREREISALHTSYNMVSGQPVAYSTFYEWFKPELGKLLRELVGDLLSNAAVAGQEVKGLLAKFGSIVATDSCVIRLHDSLEKLFPGCRTNHTKAAIKAHAVMTVAGSGPSTVTLTSERVNDGKALKIGSWVKGRLILFDLGYYWYRMFDRIRANGGWFISRLKVNANPRIVAVNRAWRGRSVPVVGEKLQDVIGRLTREVLDVMVEVSVVRRVYRGRARRVKTTFRVVAVRDDSDGEYHLYITNIPVEMLSAQEVAAIYSARWTVELLFRELGQRHRLKDMPSANRHVVEALIYGSLLSLIASRRLMLCLKLRLVDEQSARLPHERTAAVFERLAPQLLALIVAPHYWHAFHSEHLEDIARRHAVDPHKTRPLLLERVDLGIQLDYLKMVPRAEAAA